MRHALPILLILLVVSAGCMITTGPGKSTSTPVEQTDGTPTAERDEPPSSSPTSTLDLTGTGVACNDDLWVSFWGLEPEPESFWEPDVARVGYYVPPNTSFFVVTYVDGSREGVKYVNYSDNGDGVHVDGGDST